MKERIELNTHSIYDTMDSVLTLEDMIELAKGNEMPAVALTDLNCVQGFPRFSEYCDKAGIKPISGAQIIHSDFGSAYPLISTVLVKNQTGLKNLYKIISALRDDGVCKNVPISVLQKYHNGLLYGSAGHEGDIYSSYYHNDFKDFEKFTDFYDYFEIENFYKNEKEREINKKIVALAKENGKSVVAASNARYIDKKDSVCLDIMQSRTKRWCGNTENLYFRTTEEMLREFSYLGEDTENVVINNTYTIANQIKSVDVFPDAIFYETVENAYKQVKTLSLGFCENKYSMDNSNNTPQEIKERLNAELRLPVVKDYADELLVARMFVREVKGHGKCIGTWNAVASSFIAYCLGITDINPLPPHYYCPNCKKVEWVNEVNCGYDLPNKKCSCGSTMQGDGVNIPFEFFYGFSGDKVPNIRLDTEQKMQDLVSNALKTKYNINLAFTNEIRTISKQDAKRLISEYETKTNKQFTADQKEKIINKLINVKKDDEVYPKNLIILPNSKNIAELTPICEEKYHGLPIAHFPLEELEYFIGNIKLGAGQSEYFLSLLQYATGVKAIDVPINNKAIFELVKYNDLNEIIGLRGKPATQMINTFKPKTFFELLKIIGFLFACGADTIKLYESGICNINKTPAFREDVYFDLLSQGLSKSKAYKYAEAVRKGLFYKKQSPDNNLKNFRKDLKQIGIPDWYTDYCENTFYLDKKADCAEVLRLAAIEAWYKVNYPKEFETVYEIAENSGI